MARLKDVVDECLSVATAFASINSQTFNELGAVNYEDNDKSFPLFLFDKISLNIAVDKFSRTNLASSLTYKQVFYFFDTYTEAEKLTTDVQTKIDALMVIADQYFAELRSRNQSGKNGFYLGDVNLNVRDETHSDRLVQVSYEVDLIVKAESCTLGSFTYAGVEQPTNLVKTSNTDSQIIIGWTDNATSETGYEVWRSLDGLTFTLLNTIAADSTSYTDTGLTAETAYIYKVRAITSTANGEFSNQLAVCTDSAAGASPSGIAYQRPQTTGQTTSYRTGDDVWAKANRPAPANPSNPLYIAELSDFFTLVNNNAFGDTNRFTDYYGGQTFTDYILDNHTGLGYSNVRGFGNWDAMIDQSLAYTDAYGNSDYFLADQSQQYSIYNEEAQQFSYAPFTSFWGSTFFAYSSTTVNANGYGRRSSNQYVGLPTIKTTNNYGLRCRWHF